ncbi:hypothetical protein BOX15_Mlig016155g2, partial [Macrostomum lignano]
PEHRKEHVAKLERDLASVTREYQMNRMKSSETIPQILQYIKDHANEDHLLHPAKENPFNPKRSCVLL